MRDKPYTIRATYGSHRTPCDLYVMPWRGGYWYAVDGSRNVNWTHEEPTDGCDIEALPDSDAFTWPDGVDSEEALELAVES